MTHPEATGQEGRTTEGDHPPCCPQPDWEPEMWRCEHGITWTDWPDYEDE